MRTSKEMRNERKKKVLVKYGGDIGQEKGRRLKAL